MALKQAYFSPSTYWNVELDATWDVLGPFPIHAREQYFLSPSFPLNLSEPINYLQSWPSSYADGGFVNWSKATTSEQGDIEVSFPDIRWQSLRSTEGWAALQHHAILRTTLTLYPSPNVISGCIPRLLIDLKQGSYLTLRSQDQPLSSFVPVWYAGNIYDMERALPHVVELPIAASMTKPTRYDLFVSGDYEIRLFGDPLVHHNEVPVQKLSIHVEVQSDSAPVVHQLSQDVACDFLAGYAFGDSIGVGIQSIERWWTVENVIPKNQSMGIRLRLIDAITIAPSQTRILPLVIVQTDPYFGENIEFDVCLVSGDICEIISVSIPVTQRRLEEMTHPRVLKGTFLFASSMPSSFLAIPPTTKSVSQSHSPFIALHGAGVDILRQEFWANSLPENKFSWMIIPTGRTSWVGLDWHGPSAQDAWMSLEALANIVEKSNYGFPSSWTIPSNVEVVVIGHSNGGQGAWYFASRHPDRVLAAIPAAAYIKSQSYIPLTLARSGHFIDPSLRSILESSFTADDNDVHMSNLVDTPILSIHGGLDENVPVWHSREAVSVLKTWYPLANVSFQEDPGEGHWYSRVLNNPNTQGFLDKVMSDSRTRNHSDSFTLTVTVPQESGSLHGWKIDQLRIPGRLARLHVHKINEFKFVVETSNVCSFTLPTLVGPHEITVDDDIFSVSDTLQPIQLYTKDGVRKWQSRPPVNIMQPPSRIQSILSTAGSITIVISEHMKEHNLSVATRLAHVLNLYHRLDTEIIAESVAFTRNQLASWSPGNVVFIGMPSSPFAKEILGRHKTPFRIIDSTIYFESRKFEKQGQALLFTHPHPSRRDCFMVFLLANDNWGLERVARLFPFRTGVAVPDWIVVGSGMDAFGAGGIEGAGVWNPDWNLSEAMSWFSH